MKKYLVIIAVLLLFVLGVIMFFSTSVQYESIIVDGEYVDNIYNNKVFNNGNLLRIDDKLYYNYNSDNYFKYGLYEISQEGIKKIYSPGFVYYPYQADLFSLQNFDKELFVGTPNNMPVGVDIKTLNQNYIVAVNPYTKSFYVSEIFNDFTDENILYYHIIKNKIYVITDEAVYLKGDSGYKKILEIRNVYNVHYPMCSDSFAGMFFDDSRIYYFSKQSSTFTCLDVETESTIEYFKNDVIVDLLKIESLEDINYHFFVIDNYLIFSTSEDYNSTKVNCFYKANLLTSEIESIGKPLYGYTFLYNFYNNSLFASTEKSGLYSIDVNTNEVKHLCDVSIEEIYITDKKYVYFTDIDKSLYRITQDGNKLNKIF